MKVELYKWYNVHDIPVPDSYRSDSKQQLVIHQPEVVRPNGRNRLQARTVFRGQEGSRVISHWMVIEVPS